MVLPVISCEVELSYSVLRRIKTFLRKTIGNDRLNGLALFNVHSGTQYIPSVSEVKGKFLLKKSHLLQSTLTRFYTE